MKKRLRITRRETQVIGVEDGGGEGRWKDRRRMRKRKRVSAVNMNQ